MEYTRDELLNLFAEVRQAALTESLGQVTCPGDDHEQRTVTVDWADDTPSSSFAVRFIPCPDCGAAV